MRTNGFWKLRNYLPMSLCCRFTLMIDSSRHHTTETRDEDGKFVVAKKLTFYSSMPIPSYIFSIFLFFLYRLLLSGSLLITKSSVNDREINPLNYSLLINYQFRYPSGDVQRGFCNVFGTFQKSFYWKYLHKRQIQRSDLSSGIFF